MSSSTFGAARHGVASADAPATLLPPASAGGVGSVPRPEVGTHWQCFSTARGLWGVSLWGCPLPETIQELLRRVRQCFEQDSPSCLLLDLRGLTGIDAGGLELLLEPGGVLPSLSLPRLERRALVRPPGSVGAVAAAFFRLLDLGGDAGTFTDLSEALSWLLRSASPLRHEAFLKACDPLHGSPLIARLRAEIIGALGADLDTVAARLGLSGRTLQRRLRRQGTSFQDEVNEARLDEARRRMKVQDVSLTCVALDLGFGSGQNFSRWFRQMSGMTPSHWRATSLQEE